MGTKRKTNPNFEKKTVCVPKNKQESGKCTDRTFYVKKNTSSSKLEMDIVINMLQRADSGTLDLDEYTEKSSNALNDIINIFIALNKIIDTRFIPKYIHEETTNIRRKIDVEEIKDLKKSIIEYLPEESVGMFIKKRTPNVYKQLIDQKTRVFDTSELENFIPRLLDKDGNKIKLGDTFFFQDDGVEKKGTLTRIVNYKVEKDEIKCVLDDETYIIVENGIPNVEISKKSMNEKSKLDVECDLLVEKYGGYKKEPKGASSAKKMWSELNIDTNDLLGRIENAIARAKNSEEIKDLKKKRTRIEEINGELHTDMDLYLSREETTSERNLALMQRYLDLTKKDPISFDENSKTMKTLFAMYSKDFSKEDLEKAYKIMDELAEISRKLR